jgi:hypothetical protein
MLYFYQKGPSKGRRLQNDTKQTDEGMEDHARAGKARFTLGLP